MTDLDDWISGGAVFNPAHKYGIIDSEFISIEKFEQSARKFLPKGTPFKILSDENRKELAWYYSSDGKVPNPNTVKVLKECIS